MKVKKLKGFIIIGIILAGGPGTRLSPLTKVTTKHLLTVYNELIIHKVIKTLTNLGVEDIIIVLVVKAYVILLDCIILTSVID